MANNFDGPVLLVPNFIPAEEIQVLKDWTNQAVIDGQFVDGITGDWDKKEFD